MNRIQKIKVGEKEILCVDHSDFSINQMIELSNEGMQLILTESKPVFILTIFNERNFATPKVMRHFEYVNQHCLHLIIKRAIVGLSPLKKIILAGFNQIFKRDFRAFNTREEAIEYLASD